jgi:hypothetical protein
MTTTPYMSMTTTTYMYLVVIINTLQSSLWTPYSHLLRRLLGCKIAAYQSFLWYRAVQSVATITVIVQDNIQLILQFLCITLSTVSIISKLKASSSALPNPISFMRFISSKHSIIHIIRGKNATYCNACKCMIYYQMYFLKEYNLHVSDKVCVFTANKYITLSDPGGCAI